MRQTCLAIPEDLCVNVDFWLSEENECRLKLASTSTYDVSSSPARGSETACLGRQASDRRRSRDESDSVDLHYFTW